MIGCPTLDLTLAIAHHLLIFLLAGILAFEIGAIRASMRGEAVSRVGRVDAWYGILALAIIVVGFSRAIFAAKGWDYYVHNAFFWAKLGTFLTIGLLSVPPTVAYIKWQRSSTVPSADEVGRVRRLLWTEIVLFALLPVFAAAMARGYGEF